MTTEGLDATREMLLFKLGDRELAVASAHVGLVTLPQTVTAVPMAPRHVLGVANVQGHLLAVIDLSVLMGGEPSVSPRRFVVLRTGRWEAAIPVAAIARLDAFPERSFEPPPPHLDGHGFIVAQLADGHVIRLDLDAPALLEQARVAEGAR